MVETAPHGGARAVSQREREVLAGIGAHLSNAQIATRLHLSVRTVESHVSALLRKLGVEDRRALAALAPMAASGGADVDAAGELGVLRGRPAAWTRFVGRALEAQALLAALQDNRLVTLLGPGGVGKTRLAAEVADRVASTQAGGGAFVALVGARSEFLVQAVAAVLDVAERGRQPLEQAVLDRLRRGRFLLVLDNCEHVIEPAAAFVATALAQCPEVRVLATSRERLGVPGERVVPLPGLSVGANQPTDAVTLFLDRARTADPSFAAHLEEVAELCTHLDGMPLAIELAAARTPSMGVRELNEGLSDRLSLLSGGRGADARHSSMRAVINWSHDLLDEDERRVLRRLAVFADRFSLGGAAAVVGVDGDVTAVIGRLADKSLLEHRPGAVGSRWRLLETVRMYARERLEEAGELAQARRRHLRWCAAAAVELDARLDTDHDWQTDFDLLVDDLRAASAASLTIDEAEAEAEADAAGHAVDGDAAAARRLAGALGHLTYARRFLAEARAHFLTAAALAADEADRAIQLRRAAEVAQTEMRGQTMFDLRLAAAAAAQSAGQPSVQAEILSEAVEQGIRFPAMFEQDVSRQRLGELLTSAETLATVAPAPTVLAHLAAARAWLDSAGDDSAHTSLLDHALTAARTAQDPVLISAALDTVGNAAMQSGDLDTNYRCGEERLALLPSFPAHRPRCGLEIVDVLQMGVANAVTSGHLLESLELTKRFDDLQAVPSVPYLRSSKPIPALVLLGRFEEAVAYGIESRRLWEDAGRTPARWMAPSVCLVALAEAVRGNDAQADAWTRFARVDVAGEQSAGIHFSVAGAAAFTDARIALHRGRMEEARAAVADIPTGAHAWENTRHFFFDAYPWAIAAEVAAVAGASDAEACLAAAEPAGQQNPWAAALLHRARGRLHDDPDELAAAVAGWEAIEARFERACTLLLMPTRVAEGRAELAALGATLPAV